MERVTRSSALTELPARPDVEGAPGFFGPGDKTTGTPASVPGYEWFNMVQEELCNIVSELGTDELSGAAYNQVAQAILHAISQAVPDSIDWGNILNKPASYPPSSHGHSWSGISDKPTTFAPIPHNHSFEQVPGLQTALDGKAASLHAHTIDQVDNLQVILDGKAPLTSTLLSTRSTPGIWTIPWTRQSPLFLLLDGGAAVESIFKYKVNSGTGGNGQTATAGYYFTIVSSTNVSNADPNGTVIMPNASTVEIDVNTLTDGAIVEAWQ